MIDQVRVDTCRGLFDSLGVEDIAVIYGHNVDDVREVVKALRKKHLLPNIIEQAGERHAKRKARKV